MLTRRILLASAAVIGLAFGAAQVRAAEEVEVIHWWTSGGEAAALQVLRGNLEKEGVAWKDAAIAGGGGDQARTVLQARMAAGDPPTAMQMLGLVVQDWAGQGVLGDLTPLAEKDGWDKVIPPALQAIDKYDGHYVAAPFNMHSHQLGLGEQGAVRQGRRHRAQDLRGLPGAGAEVQGCRRDPGGAWRPGLAGRDDLRRRGDQRRRAGVLQEGLHRARRGGPGLRHDGQGVRPVAGDPRHGRPELPRPRLEPRHRHGHQRPGRHADHGRLGQGRVDQRRQGAGHRTCSASAIPARRGRSPSTATRSA